MGTKANGRNRIAGLALAALAACSGDPLGSSRGVDDVTGAWWLRSSLIEQSCGLDLPEDEVVVDLVFYQFGSVLESYFTDGTRMHGSIVPATGEFHFENDPAEGETVFESIVGVFPSDDRMQATLVSLLELEGGGECRIEAETEGERRIAPGDPLRPAGAWLFGGGVDPGCAVPIPAMEARIWEVSGFGDAFHVRPAGSEAVLSGSVGADGRFAATERIETEEGTTFTVEIEGRFTSNFGIEATTRVSSEPAAACARTLERTGKRISSGT